MISFACKAIGDTFTTFLYKKDYSFNNKNINGLLMTIMMPMTMLLGYNDTTFEQKIKNTTNDFSSYSSFAPVITEINTAKIFFGKFQ